MYFFNGITTPYGLFDLKIWFLGNKNGLEVEIEKKKKKKKKRERERERIVRFGMVYFNGISTPCGLFDSKLWFLGNKKRISSRYWKEEEEEEEEEEEGARERERERKRERERESYSI